MSERLKNHKNNKKKNLDYNETPKDGPVKIKSANQKPETHRDNTKFTTNKKVSPAASTPKVDSTEGDK